MLPNNLGLFYDPLSL